MNKEEKIISLIRQAYKTRLAEAVILGALEEADVSDERGNTIISKDLKVRHKSSGYEYTVERVEGEGEEAIIYLRHPEDPRITPADSELALHEKTKISLKGLDMTNMAAGQDLGIAAPATVDLEKEDLESKSPASLISVTAKEFEKEYEVE
tara:strand:- start:5823 stop:6275 length:453 start_codon:yes stop_codon:yes gene_type:complete